MPTYEYACRDCAEHLEVVQSFRDEPLTKCPRCGGPLRKVFGAIGIAFKGSGFYKNDSRSSTASRNTPKPDAAAADSAKSSDGSKSESKPSDTSKAAGSDGGAKAPAAKVPVAKAEPRAATGS